MSKRALTVLGLAVAGGAGYYLYTAGGDPKVAQKQFEGDLSTSPFPAVPRLTTWSQPMPRKRLPK